MTSVPVPVVDNDEGRRDLVSLAIDKTLPGHVAEQASSYSGALRTLAGPHAFDLVVTVSTPTSVIERNRTFLRRKCDPKAFDGCNGGDHPVQLLREVGDPRWRQTWLPACKSPLAAGVPRAGHLPSIRGHAFGGTPLLISQH